MKQATFLLLTSLLTIAPCPAQTNTVNAATFGRRVSHYAGDPLAGTEYRETAADFAVPIATAGAKIVAFSPTGTHFVTAGGTTAWLWNAATGKAVAGLPNNTPVTFVSFSPDGSYVVVGGSSSAKIWDVPSAKFRAQLTTSSGGMLYAVISRYGQYIATATAGNFSVWSASNGLMLFNGPNSNRLSSILFNPDSTNLLTISSNGTQLWRIPDGQMIGNISESNAARIAVFSPDGSRLIVGSDNWAYLWDTKGFIKVGDIQYGDGYK